GLGVEIVELFSGVDTLFIHEDLDAKLHRSLDLCRVACGANGDGQTAARVGGVAVTCCWLLPSP
ncbi:MAG: hypothetical protein WB866_11770, partial [Solirubrobacterales bacterium]